MEPKKDFRHVRRISDAESDAMEIANSPKWGILVTLAIIIGIPSYLWGPDSAILVALVYFGLLLLFLAQKALALLLEISEKLDK